MEVRGLSIDKIGRLGQSGLVDESESLCGGMACTCPASTSEGGGGWAGPGSLDQSEGLRVCAGTGLKGWGYRRRAFPLHLAKPHLHTKAWGRGGLWAGIHLVSMAGVVYTAHQNPRLYP